VNIAQRNWTPTLHQNTILLMGTLKPTPIPILIGAPTLIVPNKPNICNRSSDSSSGVLLYTKYTVIAV